MKKHLLSHLKVLSSHLNWGARLDSFDSKMALSNQSQFPRFFSPRKMTYRNLANSGLRQAGIACPRKMTFQRHLIP
jgi:hypothetical protein